MDSVLVIDDNRAICAALQLLFEVHDIPCLTASSPQEGLVLAKEPGIGVILQDMNFAEDNTSGKEGVQLFHQLKALVPEVPILLMTAWTTLSTAVQMVKEGAHDYLGKPWDDARLVEEVQQLLRNRQSQSAGSSSLEGDLCGLIYADAAMHQLVSLALRVARSDVSVLITGPNGAGKEKIAELIQANSRRVKEPFVKVNAGGLPNELLESELFGAEAGAFTGARNRRIGRFEEAHGGTLFLDEIGNLSREGQMKLLRVLQSGEFSRLGSNRVIATDVRIISATNADLTAAIKEGSFREDLFFRLNVVELHLPALVQRPADILLLAKHFLQVLGEGLGPKTLSPEAERCLLFHNWPGNVRELHNRLQRAQLIQADTRITPSDLGLGNTFDSSAIVEKPGLDEAGRLREALEEAGGNISQVAARLGLSRQALYRRMEKHDIVWQRRPQ